MPKCENFGIFIMNRGKRKTLNGAKLVKGFSWCTQQDSNLWPFDS